MEVLHNAIDIYFIFVEHSFFLNFFYCVSGIAISYFSASNNIIHVLNSTLLKRKWGIIGQTSHEGYLIYFIKSKFILKTIIILARDKS